MTTTKWMKEAKVVDLSNGRGNGPFSRFLGVVLHVNVDRAGTPDSFWRNNPGQVTPNFQVYKSEAAGGIHQMLPFDWQPWCQIDGNFNYAAIETAGYPDEPLTDYQMHAIARILRIYRSDMGLKLQLADKPGAKGFGTHVMGGAAWGGHSCPGPLRSAQRAQILTLAKAAPSKPATPTVPTKPATPPDLLEELMALNPNSADYKRFVDDVSDAVVAKVYGFKLTNEVKQNVPFSAFVKNDHLRLVQIQEALRAIAKAVK